MDFFFKWIYSGRTKRNGVVIPDMGSDCIRSASFIDVPISANQIVVANIIPIWRRKHIKEQDETHIYILKQQLFDGYSKIAGSFNVWVYDLI